MQRRVRMALVSAVGAAALAAPAFAGPVNLGFESGLAGWTASGATYLAQTVGSTGMLGASGDIGTWNAAEGSSFALLATGGGTNMATKLSQTFAALAGDLLSFQVFFDTGDYLPYNDDATVRLTNLTSGATTELYRKDVAAVGNFGETPWTVVNHTFSLAGNYRLEFAVTNRRDNKRLSIFGVDSAPSVVPMPPAALLAVAGGSLLVGIRVRRGRRLGWAD